MDDVVFLQTNRPGKMEVEDKERSPPQDTRQEVLKTTWPPASKLESEQKKPSTKKNRVMKRRTKMM